MTAAAVGGLGRSTEPGGQLPGRHTSVVAYVGYLPKPVTPATPVAQRRALGRQAAASRPTSAARRRHPGRPGDLDPHLDPVHPRARSQLERGARLGALRRGGAQRRQAGPAAHGPARCSRRACPSSCASARPTPATTSPARSRTPSGCEAVYRRRRSRPTPTRPRYTPVARARCRQLVGSYGGFWQPGALARGAGDRVISVPGPGTPRSARPRSPEHRGRAEPRARRGDGSRRSPRRRHRVRRDVGGELDGGSRRASTADATVGPASPALRSGERQPRRWRCGGRFTSALRGFVEPEAAAPGRRSRARHAAVGPPLPA